MAAAFSRLTGVLRLGAIVFAFRADLPRGDAFSTASNLPNIVVDLIGGAALLGLLYQLRRPDFKRRASAVPAAAGLGAGLAVIVAALAAPITSALELRVGPVVVAVFAGQIPAYLVLTAVNAEDQARGRFGRSLSATAVANVVSVVALLVLSSLGAPDAVLALALTVPLLAGAAVLAFRPDRPADARTPWGVHLALLITVLRASPRLVATSLAPAIAYFVGVRADSTPGALLSFNLALAAMGSLAAVVAIPAVDVALRAHGGTATRSVVAASAFAAAVLLALSAALSTSLGSWPGLPSQLAVDVLFTAIFFPVVVALYAAQRTAIVHDLRLGLASAGLAASVGGAVLLAGQLGTTAAWGCCYAAALLPSLLRFTRTARRCYLS